VTIHASDVFRSVTQTATQVEIETGGQLHRRGIYRQLFKRMMDVTLVILGGIVALPLILILSCLIARDGHAPFYWSDRVGRGGRVFRMLKLRSMVHEADAKLEAHLAADPAAAAEWASTQKLKQDPRVTTLGRILRKSSLDELPQIWNVLKGDMSLIGPRPMMPCQRALYPGGAYYRLRPGMTGPWQVSDRNDSTFVKRADFDRDYDRSLSLWYDLHILARTVTTVMKGTGF